MKVLLLANYKPDSQQSMQRLADLFLSELEGRGIEVDTIRPEQVLLKRGASTKGIGKILGYIDKYLIFPAALRAVVKRYDVLHILDHSNAIYTAISGADRVVVTCCDMLAIRSALGEFAENPTRRSGRCLQKMILIGLKQADRYVCISDATRKDLLRLTGRDEESAVTVYLGLNYPYSRMREDEAGSMLDKAGLDIKAPFLLNVGKNNWYKNRAGLLKIYKHIIDSGDIPHELVIAGEPLNKSSLEKLNEYGIRHRVVEASGPSNELLRALYSLSDGLIHPSIAEGFGWPIVEAQACGCPVFTTGKAPMTEAGGDAAVYFDPADPRECAGVIIKALKDKDRMKVLREEGMKNAGRFEPGEMAEKYIRIYKEMLRDGPDPITDNS